MNKLLEYAKRPEVYAENTAKFWDDDYISKNMLAAHLNPNMEAASRSFNFLDESVSWINEIAPLNKFNKVLDLGCGPGLYADRLNKLGYQVTGIDYSKRSIEYAKNTNRDNTYLYQDYLDINYKEEFDVVLLIFCDYAVIETKKRKELLKKIYQALKPGGKFILDVFTPNQYKEDKETTSFSLNEGGGFWRDKTYLVLKSHLIYENDLRLDQYIILDEDESIEVYRVWDKFFTTDSFLEEVKDIKFKEINFYSDVKGTKYNVESKTMGIVLEK